jgi:ribosomal protein S18 acetylase RimI-like enzyme
MDVRIEPADATHFPQIAALAGIIWRAHYPGIISTAQIDYMLAQMYDLARMTREWEEGVTYERLTVGGELRGFTAYGPYAGNELKLHKLYIHPESQRQGFGQLLLQHVENVARERGCSSVVLTVNKRNASAIAAYRKHGFIFRESVVVPIGGGFEMDDYVMTKAILKPD